MSPETAAVYCDAKAVDPEASARAKRLAELKVRLRREFPERCFDYEANWNRETERVDGLESWGRMVEAKLRAAFEDEFADDRAPTELTWQQVESEALANFIEDRARGFVGRTDTLERIEAVLASPAGEAPWTVCITGEAGAGKTALFGEIYRRLRARGVFILAHAPDASTRGPWIGNMLQRFFLDLISQPDAVHLFRFTKEGEIVARERDLLDAAVSPNATEEDIYAALGLFLARAGSWQRVVILVDAVNQLQPTDSQTRFVNWLQKDWPPNVRVLITTSEVDPSAALWEHPGIALLPLPALDDTEARAIARGICDRYHRDLEPMVVDALIAKRGPACPAWAIPLWLVLAVEELNLLDADDFARAKRDYQGRYDERLTALMCDLIGEMPADVQGMYRAGIARAEAMFGQPLVYAFLGMISVGRAGWREGDFRVLLPMLSGTTWDELQFASLRRLFRGQLRRQGPVGRWNFVHRQMRLAVRAWLDEIGKEERSVHTAIVDHLLALPRNDPARISEVMLHLMESEDWTRAANYLGALDTDEAETDKAVRGLVSWYQGTEHTREEAAHRLSLLLNAEGIDDVIRSRVAAGVLHLHYRTQGRCTLAAEQITLMAVEDCLRRLVLRAPKNVEFLKQRARSLTWLGHLRKDQGDLEEALRSYRGAAAIREQIATLEPGTADQHKQDSGDTIAIGDALLAQGDLEGALACYRHPANLKESVGHARIGVVLRMQGDLNGALASFRAGMAILKRELEADPANQPLLLNLGIAHSTIGTALADLSDLEGALVSYRTSMEIIGRVAAQNPTDPHVQSEWASTHYRMADVLRLQGDIDGALASLHRGIPILERVVAQYPDNLHYLHSLTVFKLQLGRLREELGDVESALAYWRSAAPILERLAAHDPTNAQWQSDLAWIWGNIGVALQSKGDLNAALDAFRLEMPILERLASRDSANTTKQRAVAERRSTIADLSRKVERDAEVDKSTPRGFPQSGSIARKLYRWLLRK